MNQSSSHIAPLTSLRFIAAMMIFIVHASGLIGIPNFRSAFAFGSGVSFFYVLSGFILTYVYLRPGKVINLRSFFRKRFFRLYPLHIVTLIAVVLFLPHVQDTLGRRLTQLPLQLTLTQSWLGTRYAAHGFNSPAWSISTEFGFYILFPFLLKLYDRIYSVFIVVAGLTIAAISAAIYMDGIVSAWLWEALHVHPLGRLMEFICGICAAKLFLNQSKMQWSKGAFSTLEFIAVVLIVVTGSMNEEIFEWLKTLPDSLEIIGYITRSGMFVLFGFLIWVIAHQKGYFSQLLSHKALVFLGEISFALYLVHQPVLSFFDQNHDLMNGYPPIVTFSSLLFMSLGLSFAAYKFIGVPFQKLGRANWRVFATAYKNHIKSGRVWAVLTLAVLTGFVMSYFSPGYQSPSEDVLTAFSQDAIQSDYQAKNDEARLTHYRFEKRDDSLCYEMLWQIGAMTYDTPIMRIVNIPYEGRRKTIFHDTFLGPKAWQNIDDKTVHVLDDFCIPNWALLSESIEAPNLTEASLVRITLRQKTDGNYKPFIFQNNARLQPMLLIDLEQPEKFFWPE